MEQTEKRAIAMQRKQSVPSRLSFSTTNRKAHMPEFVNPAVSDSDAAFLGWQQTLSGDLIPLFNITVAEHPSCHSTVTDVTLRRLRLRVPRTPSPYPETGPAPWHNVGIELDHPKTAREAIEIAGLDYTVVTRPLELQTGLTQDAFTTMRTDTGDVLGIIGKGYEPIQNRDAFAFFDALVDEQEAVYDTAGVLGLGESIWILAKLPGCIKVNHNDIVNKYILLTNSHDGSAHMRLKLTPIRVVCNNTLTSALQGAGEVRIHHTSNAAHHLEQAVTTLGWADSLYEGLDIKFNRMAARKITEKQLLAYVDALVPDNEGERSRATTEEIRSDMLRLYDSGWGAKLAHGTFWGAFNSVTEYTDHKTSGEDMSRRLNSIWFGRGEQFKLKAFYLAERMMQA